jgi:hypothetical protein
MALFASDEKESKDLGLSTVLEQEPDSESEGSFTALIAEGTLVGRPCDLSPLLRSVC